MGGSVPLTAKPQFLLDLNLKISIFSSFAELVGQRWWAACWRRHVGDSLLPAPGDAIFNRRSGGADFSSATATRAESLLPTSYVRIP
jgi:hypothetical protein